LYEKIGIVIRNPCRWQLPGGAVCKHGLILHPFTTTKHPPPSSLQVGGAGCPVVCQCPAGPASCPPGVSLVADGCGCCKVCAAQLNQDCHEEGRPCDHHKGLECNYGNDVGRTHGICRGRYGRGRGGREGVVIMIQGDM